MNLKSSATCLLDGGMVAPTMFGGQHMAKEHK